MVRSIRSPRWQPVLGISLFLALGASVTSFAVEKKYQRSCAVCHVAAVAGAPKSFDEKAWAPRLALGIDALVQAVKQGKGAMPAKGLCGDCSDEEFKALIEYMSKARP